jgi:hypothetical protein
MCRPWQRLNRLSVLDICIGFDAFTAGIAETKILWLVSTVLVGRTASFLRLTGLNSGLEP